MKKIIFFFSISFIFLLFSSIIQAQDISRSENRIIKPFGQLPLEGDNLLTITHSASQTIITGNSVACNAGGLHTDNSYFRAFNLINFGITEDFNVSMVEIGVEQAIGTGGTQPISVRLYTSNPAFPTGYPGSLTQIGFSNVNIPDQALTLFQIPVTGTAPAGSELVVEIFTPNGQTTGNSFFIGSNNLGETGPSYLMAADCGVTTPLTTSQIGFPGMMIVMNVIGEAGPPCPIGAPSNPYPANGATNIPISGVTATWTNGTGTVSNEVWFGTPGSLTKVYDGAAITSFPLPTLNYVTVYQWYIVCKDATCGKNGPTWSFTTIQDPNYNCLFTENFEGSLSSWTITNLGGSCVWTQYFPPYPNSYTLPCGGGCGGVLSADVDECGPSTTINSAAQIGPFNVSQYQSGEIIFDQDFLILGADECYVEVSTNGTNWTIVWSQVGSSLRNTTETVNVSSQVALQPQVWIRWRSVQPGWDWWWTIDNVQFCVYDPIPVELTAFTANADFGVVELQWITATETNNQGFEVQRSAGGEFETIAFVDGYGTTTQTQVYTYTDKSVEVGSYSYRLKQIDFDGTFVYSNEIEVDVPAPAEFALDQNYPNPFNPSTKIAFRLAVDSKVSLKVFDVLGQEVATLVNANLGVGAHNIDFDASSLNSGVYLYRIEATGIDGTNFVDVKKMILTK